MGITEQSRTESTGSPQLHKLQAALKGVDPVIADSKMGRHWLAAGARPLVSSEPVGDFLATLAHSPIPDRLAIQPDIAEFICDLVRRLVLRTEGRPKKDCESLSLAATRLAMAAILDPHYTDIVAIAARAQKECALPPFTYPEGAHRHGGEVPWDVRRSETVQDFARWAHRLIDDTDRGGCAQPPERRHGSERRLDYYMRVVAHQTNSYALEYDSVAVASLTLRHIASQDWSKCSSEHARVALAVALEILRGIAYPKACHFSVCEDHGLGSIDHNCIRLRVGHGYQPQDDCLQKSEYCIPVPPFLSGLVARVCQGGPLRELGLGLGPENLRMRDQLLEHALKNHRAIFPCVRQLTMHGAFATLGVDCLGIDPVIVSQLLGRPLPGLRGPCDYLRTTESELSSALSRIWSELFKRTGLAQLATEQLLRAVSADLGQGRDDTPHLYRGMLTHTEGISCWNDLMAAIELFGRATLAVRPSLTHLHLGACVRTDPTLAVELADKIVAGGRRHRWVALLPSAADLLSVLSATCPHCTELPYRDGDRWCTFAQLPDAERHRLTRDWLWLEGEKNWRAVLVNALRHVGASQLVKFSICGHGPSVLQWNGHASPYPLVDILGEQRVALARVYDTFGINQIAQTLKAKLVQLRAEAPDHATRIGGTDPLPRREIGLSGVGDGKLMVPPLTDAEHLIAQRLSKAVAESEHNWGVALDFAIALAVDGVPPEHLLKMRGYYDASCICNIESGETAFAALVEHEDIGGLSTLLLPLRLTSESGSVASRLLRKLTASGSRPGTMEAWLASNVDTVRRAIGTRVTRLLWPDVTRPPITPDVAYRLLQRIAVNVCLWHNGGLVAATMAGAPIELNNANPLDVAREMFGSDQLLRIDGKAWSGTPPHCDEAINGLQRFRNLLGPRMTGTKALPRTRGRPSRLPEGSGGDKLLLQWTAREWLPVFLACFPNPHRKTFERALQEAGLGMRARRMARAVYLLCGRVDAFTLSPPFPAKPIDWRQLVTRGDAFAKSQNLAADQAADLVDFTLLLYGLQLRPDEAYQLRPDFILLQTDAHDVLVHIPDGKTDAATRTISVRSICPDPDLADEIVQRLSRRMQALAPTNPDFWPALGHRRHGKLVTQFLSALDLKPYDLRHLGCIARLKALLEKHPCEWHAMATQAVQMGHAGLLQALCLYAGTGIRCATLTSRRLEREPMIAWPICDTILGRAGETALPLLLTAGQLLLDPNVAHSVITRFEHGRLAAADGGQPILLRLRAREQAPEGVVDVTLPRLPSLKPKDREILQTFLIIRCMEAGFRIALKTDADARWTLLYKLAKRLPCPVAAVRTSEM